MKEYKGIIFNSSTVSALSGKLLEEVRQRCIRTAVATNHRGSDVKAMLEEKGIKVDAVVSCYDLNRYGMIKKPRPDQLIVATAMMDLEPSEVICLSDCDRDRMACKAAGVDVMDIADVASLRGMLGANAPKRPRDYSGFKIPVTGIMGAIVGDVVGSRYEHQHTTGFNFPLFPSRSHPTDDSVATLYVARWLLGDRSSDSLIKSAVQLGNAYPKVGWSHGFTAWLRSSERAPYGAVTNGSAMRVSPCAWAAGSLEEALDLAKRAAEITHNSVEGIKGAQSVAAGIYLARTGHSKEKIKKYVEETFGYNLDTPVAQYRLNPSSDYTCEFTIPQAFCCYLQSSSYEETVRNAVSLGGDADTVAAISGSLAAATPGMEIPEDWAQTVWGLMDERMRGILADFQQNFVYKSHEIG